MSKKIVLVFSSIVIMFVIGEALARAVYVKPWYLRLTEEQAIHNLKSKQKINAFGLRDQEYPSLKSPNCKRVLVLGDSFAQGAGVDDVSAIFPEILERQLNAEFFRQGEKIEILNGGLGGTLTDCWVKLLLQVKDSFKPDVILIVFFLRDGTKTSSMGSFFGPIREEIKSRDKCSFLYQHVCLFRLIQERLDRLYLSKKYSIVLHDSYFGNAGQIKEWENAKNNILKIREIAKEIQAEVALIVFPVLVELNRGYPFKDICECIIKFGADHHIPTHSLLPAFMGKSGPDLWVSSYDQHPNEKGHLIAANSILPFLRELLISSDKRSAS